MKPNMEKSLSIILPVFNEKESLSVMVRLLNSYLKFDNEILIIYDIKIILYLKQKLLKKNLEM